MTMHESERRRLRPLAVVLAGYLASRLLFWVVGGIEFDASTLGWFWQFIDPVLLYDDALRSIWYHHAQPPLFNLYLAAALKLSAGPPALLCWASFVALGLLLHGGLFLLLRDIGVGEMCAELGVLLFAFSPASILYESWLFYTYPLAAILILAVLALVRLVGPSGRPIYALYFFGALGLASLTRSLFHPVWIIASAVLVWLVLPADRRRWTAWAALPLSLVLLVHAKNAVLFESFASSSWMGMSIAKLASEPIPLELRAAYVERGEISTVSLIEPFSRLYAYPEASGKRASPDHPVLVSPMKSTERRNLNHIAYVEISGQYLKDALVLIGSLPSYYLGSVARAWLTFALVPSDSKLLDANRARIARYERIYSAVVYGAFVMRPSGHEASASLGMRFSWLWAVAASGALLLALWQGGSKLLARRDPVQSAALLFMAGTILFVALVGNALELGENNRFRFMVEPLLWALIIWAGTRVLGRVMRTVRKSMSG